MKLLLISTSGQRSLEVYRAGLLGGHGGGETVEVSNRRIKNLFPSCVVVDKQAG